MVRVMWPRRQELRAAARRTLRLTGATLGYLHSGDLRTVQELLGHAGPRMAAHDARGADMAKRNPALLIPVKVGRGFEPQDTSRHLARNGEPATLALPSDLLATIDKLVQEGRAHSREELIENALRRELAEVRRSALDAEFREMADDAGYQSEARQILAEFAQADWETLHQDRRPGAEHRQA